MTSELHLEQTQLGVRSFHQPPITVKEQSLYRSST